MTRTLLIEGTPTDIVGAISGFEDAGWEVAFLEATTKGKMVVLKRADTVKLARKENRSHLRTKGYDGG